MSGGKVKMDPSLSLAIMEAFSAEQPCEHSCHDNPKWAEYHEGSASWYLKLQCDACAYTTGLKAVCWKWAKAAESGSRFACPGCGSSAYATILIKERIR